MAGREIFFLPAVSTRVGATVEGMQNATTSRPSAEQIRRAPKVLLHDHLDGGLRPGTIIALARAAGYGALPETEADRLGTWFRAAADSGSLERYLETFAHTCAVMQTREALVRVAAECAEDLAADGVVYAEVRYAPEQHLEGGLTLEEVVEAVNEGFREGERVARGNGYRIRVGALLTAMRHAARSQEIAELANRYRDLGVVGFDIAGAEAGFPPTRHLDAFEYLKRENNHFTIHAGEAFGLPSIWQALQWCGADRLGHGVRIIDDIQVGDPARGGSVKLGRLASYVRDKRVPLEMCPTSNLQTGAAASYAEHPIGVLRRLHFRVTVNTDNRLMSGTSMSREFEHLVAAFDYTLDDMQWFTVNAMKSAFIPFDERLAMINEVVKPGYAELKAEWLFGPGAAVPPVASDSAPQAD
jgi:adenosine deaminase